MKNIIKTLTIASILSIAAVGTVSCGNTNQPGGNGEAKKNQIYQAYCEFAGNMFMAGKGDLGPLPAEAIFYDDYTWEAHATGKAMFSDFEGSWEVNSGSLSMKLLAQDGYAKEAEDQPIEIDTSDERVWSFTLSHQDDRGTGLKYHTNHLSRYSFLKAYNEKMGKSETLPAEPTFKLTFDDGLWQQSGWFGEARVADLAGSMDEIVGHVGDVITLPSCGYTLEGYTFTQYKVFDGFNSIKQVGETYTLRDWDITVRSQFTKNA